MSKKEATISWNRPRKVWVIRYWSETEHEWLEDSAYFVKDEDPKTEMGWISETFLSRLYDLQDLGYTFTFVK